MGRIWVGVESAIHTSSLHTEVSAVLCSACCSPAAVAGTGRGAAGDRGRGGATWPRR